MFTKRTSITVDSKDDIPQIESIIQQQTQMYNVRFLLNGEGAWSDIEFSPKNKKSPPYQCKIPIALRRVLNGKPSKNRTFQIFIHFPYTQEKPVIDDYERVVVLFSGGKDSLACLLYLIENGVDKNIIELWHHDIDGRYNDPSAPLFMDWPVTTAYCKAVASHFGLPIYFSWREGGFYREMHREKALTAPVWFEDRDHNLVLLPTSGGRETNRLMFPQPGHDLKTRWCSSSLKIDVYSRAFRAQERFLDSKTLVVSGERREESPKRAKYQEFEPDRCHTDGPKVKRVAHRWRPVIDWKEKEVWDLIRRWNIQPHPAYMIGWGRLSCQFCIFGNKNQWRSNQELSPKRFKHIEKKEIQFGTTIHRTKSVKELAERGRAYKALSNKYWKRQALSERWYTPIIITEDEWRMPAGAFGDSNGPS